MNLKVQNLALVLERMVVLYERVREVIEREKNYLILLDFENLLNILREKDEILSALRALDRDRLRMQDQFALVMSRDPATLTLRGIAEALLEQSDVDPAGRRLLTLRTQLAAVTEDIRERLELNRHFIEKSVENLQDVASNLSALVGGRGRRGSQQKSQIYTGKAKYQNETIERGTLVEKRL